MNSVNTNLTKVLSSRYADKWVALNAQQTKVVASSKTPSGALRGASRKKVRDPVITFAIKDYGTLVS